MWTVPILPHFRPDGNHLAHFAQTRYNRMNIYVKEVSAMVDTSQEIRIGDVIQTRKPHPCGSSEWTVTRTGADIKIKCSGCGRIVMLDRETFLKRRKKVITQGPAVQA